jgi:hypothetical protein
MGSFTTDRVYDGQQQEIRYATVNEEFIDDDFESMEIVFQDFTRNISGHTERIMVCRGDVKTAFMLAYDAGKYTCL